jgi:hypothetical protein
MADRENNPRRQKPGVFFLGGRIKKSHLTITGTRRGRHVGLAVGILLVILGGLSLSVASADGPIQVGLYIQYEDGSTLTQCVEPDGPDATGLDVLREAELDLVFETGGFLGTAICKIGETGCDYPTQDCFCQCLGIQCQYWTYWFVDKGGWRLSPMGVSARVLTDGDVDGWVWGDGETAPPEGLLIEDICANAPTPASVDVEDQDSTFTPSPTSTAIAPTPTQTIARPEPAPSPTQGPLAIMAATPTVLQPISVEDSPNRELPVFVWLIIGLSGLGIVLLGTAYFLTSRRP